MVRLRMGLRMGLWVGLWMGLRMRLRVGLRVGLWMRLRMRLRDCSTGQGHVSSSIRCWDNRRDLVWLESTAVLA